MGRTCGPSGAHLASAPGAQARAASARPVSGRRGRTLVGCVANVTIALFASQASATPGPTAGAAGLADALPCLRAAYAELVCGAEEGALILCDRQRLRWDDGRAKPTLDERLKGADLEDQMAQPYPPAGSPLTAPDVDTDPGRVRDPRFFGAAWGATRAAVRKQLVRVRWLPSMGKKRLLFHRAHGAAAALARVSADLDRLPLPLRRIAWRTAGTFVWRPIAGTTRLSPHSYGIAVDLAVDIADYWRWQRPGPGGQLVWRNRIPVEIVAAFERHGFIWGGRWYHHDTMHFEYRPELVVAACRSR